MKLRFVSAGAAQGLVTATAAEAGVQAEGSFGAVGAMLEKLDAGEPADIVILTHAQVAGLVAARRVVAATWMELGAVATSVAVPRHAAIPAIDDADALRAALLAAEVVHFPDPAKATAGMHFAKVIDSLGVREKLGARLRTFPNGMTAMHALGEISAPAIGCTQATEILATPTVRLVGPLPRGLHLETVYTAVVDSRTHEIDSARAFLERLAGDASWPRRLAAGFQGATIRPAHAGDAPQVVALVNEVLAEYGLPPDPQGIDRDLADVPQSFAGRGGMFEVAVDSDGRIAASCGVIALDDASCELRKMYVRKDARRLGLGRRLLQRALAFSRGRGFRRMELETASPLKEAIALYEASGFRPHAGKSLARRCDQAFALDL